MSKKSYKKLNTVEFNSYLKSNNGKLVANPYFKHCNFYECDNNTLIVENTIEKRATLYFDRIRYYKELDNIVKLRSESPLKKDREIIKSLEVNKDSLLRDFFDTLGLKQPESLIDIDLKLLDKKLKQYGYQRSFENLLLPLIVFAGEYIKEKKGGHWIIEIDRSYPSELVPVFVDSTGRREDFSISIQKDFIERKKINMHEVISFALLPKFGISSKEQ